MWFIENIGSIVVGLALIAIVTLIVVSNVKNKKKGKYDGKQKYGKLQ